MPGPREFPSSQAVDQDGDADASETERRGRRHNDTDSVGDGSDDNDVDHDVGHDDDDKGGAEVAELPAYTSRGAARIVTASRAGRVRLFFAISHPQWLPRRTVCSRDLGRGLRQFPCSHGGCQIRARLLAKVFAPDSDAAFHAAANTVPQRTTGETWCEWASARQPSCATREGQARCTSERSGFARVLGMKQLRRYQL